jgi:hypothetical protein
MREAILLAMEKTLAKKSQQRRIAELINGCRQRRVKRNNENNIIIGTWNVRTPLYQGKMQVLAEQVSETQLEILAIQEIRWCGIGLIKNRITHYTIADLAVKKEKLALDLYS